MLCKNQNKYYFRTLIKRYCSSTPQPILHNEKLKKIKEFRKLTSLSLSICKDILNKNNYNIDYSINYVFQNLNANFRNNLNELKEGYYCFKHKNSLIALTELNCYNDLISENIFFKELLINLCNNLLEDNTKKRKEANDTNLDMLTITDYVHLFYKNDRIHVDKKLENVNDSNIFNKIYLNRSVNQLINYTSLILNDYIFLRNYLTLKLDALHSDNNIHLIHNSYYHKELRIEEYILCKGFSFSFLFIKSNNNIADEIKYVLQKLSLLISINILIYKPKYCSISNDFDIYKCFETSFIESCARKIKSKEPKRTVDPKSISETFTEKKKNVNNNKHNVENTNDFMLKKVHAIHILSDSLKKANFKKLNFLENENININFFELITQIENEFNIKIYTKIIYSTLNENFTIL